MGDNDYRVTAVIGAAGGAGGAVNTAEKSVVKVIRSRFVRLFENFLFYFFSFHFG